MCIYKALISAVTVSGLVLCSSAQAISCPEALEGQQEQVLSRAMASDHYTVRVLSGQAAGKIKRIVILAEGAHTKNWAESELGREFVRAFRLIGLEGGNPSLTWGGKLLNLPGKAVHEVRDRFARKKEQLPKKFRSTLRTDGKLLISVRPKTFSLSVATPPSNSERAVYGFGEYPSTIREAQVIGRTCRTRLLEDLMWLNQYYRLDELASQEADTYLFEVGEYTFSGLQMSDQIQLIENEATRAPVDIYLEHGHKPSLWENVGSVALPVVLGACAIEITRVFCDAGVGVASGNSSQSVDALYGLLALGAGAAAATYSEKIMGKFDFLSAALKYVKNIFLVNGRDETLSNGIVAGLEANPEDVMLVIIGKDHADGLVRNLSERWGFR